MVLIIPVENACIFSAKNAYALVHARICHGAEASLPYNYCELILSLAQASCRLSFSARPASCLDEISRPTLFVTKSVQIRASSWRSRRCGVAQASSSALVQASSSLSMGRTRRSTTEATRHRNAFSPFFARFLKSRWPESRRTYICICVQSTYVYVYAKRRDEISD